MPFHLISCIISNQISIVYFIDNKFFIILLPIAIRLSSECILWGITCKKVMKRWSRLRNLLNSRTSFTFITISIIISMIICITLALTHKAQMIINRTIDLALFLFNNIVILILFILLIKLIWHIYLDNLIIKLL